MSTLVTIYEFDKVLNRLHGLCKDRLLNPLTTSVKRATAEWELLQGLPLARDFMLDSLKLGDRSIWRDCLRVARLRAICETLAHSMDTKIVERSKDPRLTSCLSACECVEKVLEDWGLGKRLQDARAREHDALVQKDESLDSESNTESAWSGLGDVFSRETVCEESGNESEIFEASTQNPSRQVSDITDEEAANSDGCVAHMVMASAANAEATYLDMAGDVAGAMEQYAVCKTELILALSGRSQHVDVTKLQGQLKQVEGRMTALHPLLPGAKVSLNVKSDPGLQNNPSSEMLVPLPVPAASGAVAAGPWLASRILLA